MHKALTVSAIAVAASMALAIPATAFAADAGLSPTTQSAGSPSDFPSGPSSDFPLPEAVFTVDAVDTFAKDAFPTQKVYGSTGGRAELRLITCGGQPPITRVNDPAGQYT
ncbi:hypothetical protein [Streptomyces aquilus]|uniref:hypothetical protein n=1 Tax=Streptomyces aquilus TaxID=2548456 RepID=UPI0036B519D7